MQKNICIYVVFTVLLAILGWCSMCLPFLFSGEPIEVYGNQPFFPIMSVAANGIGALNLILLFLSGLICGFAFPLKNAATSLVGIASLFSFMFMTVLEVVLNRGHHNLFPIEILFYTAYSMVCVFGVLIGYFLRKLITKIRKAEQAGGGNVVITKIDSARPLVL